MKKLLALGFFLCAFSVLAGIPYVTYPYDTRAVILTNSGNILGGDGSKLTGVIAASTNAAAWPSISGGTSTNQAFVVGSGSTFVEGTNGYIWINGAHLTNFNVIDVTKPPFNATGAGSASDTTNIQGALDLASYSNSGPSVVLIPRGIFRLTNNLTVSAQQPLTNGGMIIKGAGMGATILRFDKTNKPAIFFAYPGGRDMRVQDLTLSGPLVNTGWDTTDTGTVAIQGGARNNADGGYNWQFSNLRIEGFQKGIQVSNIWNMVVENCYFVSNRLVSLQMSTAYLPEIRSCWFQGAANGRETDTHIQVDMGVFGASGVNGAVDGCYFSLATNAVIARDLSLTFKNCNWDRVGAAIWAVGSSQNDLVGCTFSDLWNQTPGDGSFMTNNHPAWFMADGCAAQGFRFENFAFEDDGTTPRALFWAYPTNFAVYSFVGTNMWKPVLVGGTREFYTNLFGAYGSTVKSIMYRDGFHAQKLLEFDVMGQGLVIVTNSMAGILGASQPSFSVVNGSPYGGITLGGTINNDLATNTARYGSIGYYPYGSVPPYDFPATALAMNSFDPSYPGQVSLGGDPANPLIGPSYLNFSTSTNTAGPIPKLRFTLGPTGILLGSASNNTQQASSIELGWGGQYRGYVGRATNSSGVTIDNLAAGTGSSNLTDSGYSVLARSNILAAGVISTNGFTSASGASNYFAGTTTFSGTGSNYLGPTVFSNTAAAIVFITPTNTATDTYVLTATGTAGDTAWKAAAAGSGTGIQTNGGTGVNNLFSNVTMRIASVTNNLFADSITVTNGFTNNALTASRVILTDANKNQTSAAASGAVSINADGSATTVGQIQNLGIVATNDTRALTLTGPINTGILNVTNNITNGVLTASQPVVTDANKALASSADISAFALSKTSTNDTRALTLTGPINGGILNITNNITNQVLTASRLVLSDANKALVSAAASGAVPVDADGSATTVAQLNALGMQYGGGNATLTNASLGYLNGTFQLTNGVLIVSNSTAAGKPWAKLEGDQLTLSNGVNAIQSTLTSSNLNLNGTAAGSLVTIGAQFGLSNVLKSTSGSNSLALAAGYQTNNVVWTNGLFWVMDEIRAQNALGVAAALWTSNTVNVGTTLSVGGQTFHTNSVVVTSGGAFITGVQTNANSITWSTNTQANVWAPAVDASMPVQLMTMFTSNLTINGIANLNLVQCFEPKTIITNRDSSSHQVVFPAGTRLMCGPGLNPVLSNITCTNGKTLQIDWLIYPHLGQNMTNARVWVQGN